MNVIDTQIRDDSKKLVTIVGKGVFGTAMAGRLAQSTNFKPSLQCRDAEPFFAQTESISSSLEVVNLGRNEKLDAVEGSWLTLLAVPSHAHKELLTLLPVCKSGSILTLAKGLDVETGLMLHKISSDRQLGYLCGPSFASDVACNDIIALTVAHANLNRAQAIAESLSINGLRCYATNDLIGVSLCGAIKNVVAIATGAADGLGFGMSTKAALISRGIVELQRIICAAGGQEETIFMASGIGDLTMTSLSEQSRNFSFGQQMAYQIMSPGDVDLDSKQNNLHLVEGKNTAFSIYRLAEELKVDLPICATVSEILNCDNPDLNFIEKCMQNLLERPVVK